MIFCQNLGSTSSCGGLASGVLLGIGILFFGSFNQSQNVILLLLLLTVIVTVLLGSVLLTFGYLSESSECVGEKVTVQIQSGAQAGGAGGEPLK